MPFTKTKEEMYKNVGGINQKVSVYSPNDNTVLGLENYAFQTPGAWQKRWGFTNATRNSTVTMSGAVVLDMISSFSVARGLQNMVFTSQAAYIYNFGASRYGGYTTALLTPLTMRFATSFTGGAPVGFTTVSVYDVLPPATTPNVSLTPASPRNFNYMTFWTTGKAIYKATQDIIMTGSSLRLGLFSLPYAGPFPISPAFTATPAGSGVAGGLTGTYTYYFGYRDDFGFQIPGQRPFPGHFGPVNVSGNASAAGATAMLLQNVPLDNFSFQNTGPGAYAARSMVIYRNRVPGYPSTEVVSIGEIIPGGTTTFVDSIGVSANIAGYSLVGYPLPTHQPFPQVVYNIPDNPVTPTMNYLEVFDNRLWIGIKQQDRLYFSERYAPQVIEPENFIDIVSNETELMGMVVYNQTLIVGLRNGIWRLTPADDITNSSLLELTKDYGCLSNKSMVTWKERLWFLDRGQIVEFNGTTFDTVSQPVQSIMDLVNYDAAEENSCGTHVIERNEVWFTLPVGSTQMNTVVVYDYFVQAWTTFKMGVNTQSIVQLYTDDLPRYGTIFTERNPKYFMGSDGGTLFYFEPSFKTDVTGSITCTFTTKNHQPLPKSATSQFRRLFIDPGPSNNTTLTFNVNYYANYATATVALTRSVVGATFDYRIDFGIPAKALSMKVSHASGNTGHLVYGYALESRFQRNV